MFSYPVPLQLDTKPNIYALVLHKCAHRSSLLCSPPRPQDAPGLLAFPRVSYYLSRPTAVQAAVASRSGVPPKHPGIFLDSWPHVKAHKHISEDGTILLAVFSQRAVLGGQVHQFMGLYVLTSLVKGPSPQGAGQRQQ